MDTQGLLADKDTCEFLSAAVDQISGAIIVCEVYAQRYLGQDALVDQFAHKSRAVLDQIPELLAVILRFSYLTRKLFSHSSKVFRTLSGTLGGRSYTLKDAIEELRTKLATLRETDQINYQEETLRLLRAHSHDSRTLVRLEEMSKSAFQEIDFTAAGVRNIQSEMHKGREKERKDKIQKTFKKNLEWFERGKIADIQTHVSQYRENIDRKRHKGSCQWIFRDDVTHFKNWKECDSGFLWLVGHAGFGKSVLVSTIIEHFDSEQSTESQHPADEVPILLYFFCKRGDEAATKARKIMLHLCYQLLKHEDYEDNATLQEKCNDLLDEIQKQFPSFAKMDPSLVEVPALKDLFERLVKQLGRPVVLIVDALDECEDWDDSDFVGSLVALASSNSRIRVLVSSRQLDSELLQDMSCIEINKERTKNDITYYVATSVKLSRPKWNRRMMMRAIEGITEKSLGEFKCKEEGKTEELKVNANLSSHRCNDQGGEPQGAWTRQLL